MQHIKPAIFFYLGALTFLVFACQGSNNADEAAINMMMDGMKDKIPVFTNTKIYINTINEEIQQLESRGPLTVTRDGQNYEVRVSYKDGEPVLIHTQTPMGNQQSWYYLEHRKLVSLMEVGREGPNYFENQFFYQGDTLLAALHRQAKKSKDLGSKAFQEYESNVEGIDFRVLPADAFASAMEFLQGR